MAKEYTEDIKKYEPKLPVIQHVGLLLGWYQFTSYYTGSPDNLRMIVASTTKFNLLLGWWSPVSLIINPIVTILNWSRFSRYEDEYRLFWSNPEHHTSKAIEGQIVAAKKADKGLKMALLALSFCIGIIVLVIIVNLTKS
jgi:hypothetical protein